MSSQAYGRDFYHILGITSFADAKDIKAAFRQLAKKYHPGTEHTVVGERPED
jgi:DnaJ-class molecular chaperone